MSTLDITVDALPGSVSLSIEHETNAGRSTVQVTLDPGQAERVAMLLLDRAAKAKVDG